jgi:SM-20-related protein
MGDFRRAAYPPPRSDAWRLPPSPALVLDHALPAQEAAELLEYATTNQARYIPAGTLAPDLTVEAGRFRRARTLGDLGPFRGLADRILRRHQDIVRARFGPIAVQPGTLEEEIAASGDGDFFARHNDSGAEPVAHRSFTLIIYLHREPCPFSGGALLIYGTETTPDGAIRSVPVDAIEPCHNRCVLFPAATFHEILPVTTSSGDFACNRFAVTSWI